MAVTSFNCKFDIHHIVRSTPHPSPQNVSILVYPLSVYPSPSFFIDLFHKLYISFSYNHCDFLVQTQTKLAQIDDSTLWFKNGKHIFIPKLARPHLVPLFWERLLYHPTSCLHKEEQGQDFNNNIFNWEIAPS